MSVQVRKTMAANFSKDKLKELQKNVNFDVEAERKAFLVKLHPVIQDATIDFTNFPSIWKKEQIENLLKDSVSLNNETTVKFVKFVVRIRYRDEPELDRHGKPLLRRTTPVHHLMEHDWLRDWATVPNLFKIYNRFDANYADESGLTHFHVACRYGCEEAVARFLERGQDPDCLWPDTGDRPLHLAASHGHKRIVDLLLRAGANPNLMNQYGWTALHLVCRRFPVDVNEALLPRNANGKPPPFRVICMRLDDGGDLVKHFVNRNMWKTGLVLDARDVTGRTPLQWAVANLLPNVVAVLLHNGASLSGFEFPTEDYFGVRLTQRPRENWMVFKARLAFAVFSVVVHLEKRNYELKESDARTVQKLFEEHGLLENSTEDIVKTWRASEKFLSAIEKTRIRSNLSLYQLMEMKPEQAEEAFMRADYVEFIASRKLSSLPLEGSKKVCAGYLCEVALGGFFRRWGLKSRLDPANEAREDSQPRCDHLAELINEDSWYDCLPVMAETSQSSR